MEKLCSSYPGKSGMRLWQQAVYPTAHVHDHADPSSRCNDVLDSHTCPIAAVRSGHTYHASCIVEWFESTRNQARSCPHCRQNPLVSDAEFAQVEAESRAAAHGVPETRPAMRQATGRLASIDSASEWFWSSTGAYLTEETLQWQRFDHLLHGWPRMPLL